MAKEKINVIFLDIDGVLNSLESHYFYFGYSSQNYAEMLHKKSPFENDINLLDIKHLCPRACSNLTQLLLSIPNARIVLSSTWRKNRTLEYMNRLFYTMGITQRHPCKKCDGDGGIYSSDKQGRIVRSGNCPVCEGLKTNPISIPRDIIIDGEPRGEEIEVWLNNQEDYEIENFVIIDDSNDMKPFLGTKHFINTNDVLGLTLLDVNKALEVFHTSEAIAI